MGAQALQGGKFYGSILRKRECHEAIFTELQHASPRKLPSHSHELAFFAIQLAGDYRERYGREQVDYAPFTVAFRPAGTPHQDEIGPRGVKLFEIELKPRWQTWIQQCSGSLTTACDDRRGGEMLWLGLQLLHETREPSVDQLQTESLLTELVGRAARLNHETKQAPRWLERVVEKLYCEFRERLTLSDLATEAGVHPVHLSRVFREFQQVGIGEFVRRLRIQSACRMMLAAEMSLTEIALETGFADQSHFTRAFRKVTGVSPTIFRRSCLQA